MVYRSKAEMSLLRVIQSKMAGNVFYEQTFYEEKFSDFYTKRSTFLRGKALRGKMFFVVVGLGKLV